MGCESDETIDIEDETVVKKICIVNNVLGVLITLITSVEHSQSCVFVKLRHVLLVSLKYSHSNQDVTSNISAFIAIQ